MNIYIPELKSQILSTENSLHLWTLRPKIGEVFDCCDLNGGVGKIKISKIDKMNKAFEVQIYDLNSFTNQNQNVLIQAIPDKLYLDKLYEVLPFLGLQKCYLFFSDYSLEHKPNLERLNKILIRSCEQSQTLFKPQIVFLKDKKEFMSISQKLRPKVLECKELVKSEPKKRSHNHNNVEDCTNIESIIVGPEGGWSTQEIDNFKTMNLKFVYLGSTIYPAWLAGFRYFSDQQ